MTGSQPAPPRGSLTFAAACLTVSLAPIAFGVVWGVPQVHRVEPARTEHEIGSNYIAALPPADLPHCFRPTATLSRRRLDQRSLSSRTVVNSGHRTRSTPGSGSTAVACSRTGARRSTFRARTTVTHARMADCTPCAPAQGCRSWLPGYGWLRPPIYSLVHQVFSQCADTPAMMRFRGTTAYSSRATSAPPNTPREEDDRKQHSQAIRDAAGSAAGND